MTVAEAIYIQKQFIANKYHASMGYPDYIVRESMKELTKAYDSIWDYLEAKHQDVLNEYILSLPDEVDKRTFTREDI